MTLLPSSSFTLRFGSPAPAWIALSSGTFTGPEHQPIAGLLHPHAAGKFRFEISALRGASFLGQVRKGRMNRLFTLLA